MLLTSICLFVCLRWVSVQFVAEIALFTLLFVLGPC